MAAKALTAATLLREIGLMADGPVRWGQPVRVGGPGIYVVELAAALADAPIDINKVGKWLERLPALRLDKARPTSKQLAARLASFWWPDQTILFIGTTTNSIGGRVRAYYETPLGDRRPHASGQWIQALRSLDGLRVWWASTTAPEESEDAALDAFAAAGPTPAPTRPQGALVMPWANLRRPTGERQASGITGSVVPDEPATVAPAARVTQLPPGNADGTSTEVRNSGTVRRAPGRAPVRAPAAQTSPRPSTIAEPKPRAPRATTRAAGASDRKREPVALTADAIDRMRAELDELTRVKRPEVVQRIKTAREYGDLKENAEYHAAREEQSFLEGRVRLIEDRLRHAVVIDESAGADRAGRVVLGSVVRVEQDGDELTFTIVGTTEANPAAGRISTASPVGSALLGAAAGEVVEVRTPRGVSRYRVVGVE